MSKAKPQEPPPDAARIAEVEQGLLAAAPLPDDIAAAVADGPVPDENVTATKLKQLWTAVKQREAGWKKVVERAEQQSAASAQERSRLTKLADELRASEADIQSRDAALAAAEADLAKARLAAKEGFADENRGALRDLVKHHEELLEEAAAQESKAQQKAAAILEKARQAAAAEHEAFEQDRQRLREREGQLRLDTEALASDRALMDSRQDMLERQFERRLAAALDEAESEHADLRALCEQETTRRESRDRELQELREQLARFGEDPEELVRTNETLVVTLRELRDELSRRPTGEEAQALRDGADRLRSAEARVVDLQQMNNQLDRQLRYQLTAVGELEVLRDERDSLASQRETLRQALDQQRRDWDDLQAKEGANEPFPACSALDRDERLDRKVPTRSALDLRDLVEELRHRMVTEPSTPFFYSATDIRLFLAGLAASRLHLLQGISGTGKTSLPREVFKALGGEVTIIEVQAGWRDKDDLFGYYNAFEKRFAESEFTKALYRAHLPANVDRPTVIVLDEMNLAHPEQYFGTMLSALENAVDAPVHLNLLTTPVPGLPQKFEGSQLRLPENVWFVGTANHDETTVAFADKTYDRAHVQELPHRHERFSAERQGAADPVSFAGLRAAFREAGRAHQQAMKDCLSLLQGPLLDEFAAFDVGWGNRLERQVKMFIPVTLAAGGSSTEALDHLVAIKVVRKLESRFGVDPDALDSLARDVEKLWVLDGGSPVKTVRRLREEASRLRGSRGA